MSADLEQLAAEFTEDAKAHNTKRAYRYQFAKFSAWCAEQGIANPKKASINNIRHHLVWLAHQRKANGEPYSRNTIEGRLNAITYYRRKAGKSSPFKNAKIQEVMDAVDRKLSETKGQSEALRAEDIARIGRLPRRGLTPIQARQRRRTTTAIAVMYDALLRVSECAALRWEDVIWPEDVPETGGYYLEDNAKIIIRKSKTDQAGRGVQRSLRPATTNRIDIWRDVCGFSDESGITPTGPIFGVWSCPAFTDG